METFIRSQDLCKWGVQAVKSYNLRREYLRMCVFKATPSCDVVVCVSEQSEKPPDVIRYAAPSLFAGIGAIVIMNMGNS